MCVYIYIYIYILGAIAQLLPLRFYDFIHVSGLMNCVHYLSLLGTVCEGRKHYDTIHSSSIYIYIWCD